MLVPVRTWHVFPASLPTSVLPSHYEKTKKERKKQRVSTRYLNSHKHTRARDGRGRCKLKRGPGSGGRRGASVSPPRGAPSRARAGPRAPSTRTPARRRGGRRKSEEHEWKVE
eukprot:2071169-Rhodomonas_salina.2